MSNTIELVDKKDLDIIVGEVIEDSELSSTEFDQILNEVFVTSK